MNLFARLSLIISFLLVSPFALAQNLAPEVIAGANRLRDFQLKPEQLFLIFHYEKNIIYLMKFSSRGELITLKQYISSGGRGGVSNVVKSGGTPPGVHVIYRKQGHDYALGQTFDASKYGYREQIVQPTQTKEFWASDFVLTRIMRLQGLEGEKNNNSVRRSILIHGTPPEGLLGYHESLGCLRMKNDDVIELFDTVNEGTLVNIVYTTGERRRVPKDEIILLDEKRHMRETSREIPRGGSRGPASTGDVNLIGGGDILFHGSLLLQAMVEGYGFESFFEELMPVIKQSNVAYANLEGPIAYQVNLYGQVDPKKGFDFVPNENIYSSMDETFLSFNFHPAVAKALVNVGLSVLSTANNHSFDRKFLGIDRTLEELQKVNMPAVGTKHSKNLASPWSYIKTVNGIRLGFVGCTYGIQGAGPGDSDRAFQQILFCYRGGDEPNPQVISEVKALSANVDVVIFTPHWGNEYAPQASPAQKKLASSVIAAGARIILGSHPHVLQPAEVIRENGEIKAVVAYSLGNFVTNQMPSDWVSEKNKHKQAIQFPSRVSSLVGLKIRKTGDKVVLSKPLWIPTYMPPKSLLDGKRRKLLLAYPEMYDGLLKSQVTQARGIIDRYLGPEAQVLERQQLDNVFRNIEW